jgi:DNA-binding MarR family transcriptional regulator
VTHPARDLDDVVHQRSRLGILATLAEGSRVQFGYLQQILGLTDGNLSRHLQTLAEAGYVQIEKGYQGRRPRTWIHITPAGRKALRTEIALLRALVLRVDGSESRRKADKVVEGENSAGDRAGLV